MVSAVCCVMLAEYVLNSSNTTPSALTPSCHNIGDVSESVTCKYLHCTHLTTQIRVHYCAPIHVCSLVYTNLLTDIHCIHMTRDGKLYCANLTSNHPGNCQVGLLRVQTRWLSCAMVFALDSNGGFAEWKETMKYL